jgi:hypothetical protein
MQRPFPAITRLRLGFLDRSSLVIPGWIRTKSTNTQPGPQRLISGIAKPTFVCHSPPSLPLQSRPTREPTDTHPLPILTQLLARHTQ